MIVVGCVLLVVPFQIFKSCQARPFSRLPSFLFEGNESRATAPDREIVTKGKDLVEGVIHIHLLSIKIVAPCATMRLQLEFELPKDGVVPSAIAIVLLDIQHQAVALTALALLDVGDTATMFNERWLWDPYVMKYVGMAEVDENFLSGLGLDIRVVRISYNSPLSLDVIIKTADKLGDKVTQAFRAVYKRLYFGDLERRKSEAEIDRLNIDNLAAAEEITARRLANYDKVLDLGKKLNELELRDKRVATMLRNHIYSSLEPLDPNIITLPDRSKRIRAKLTNANIEDE